MLCVQYNGIVCFLKKSVQGVRVSHFTKSFVKKKFLGIRLVSQKSKTNHTTENMIFCETFKQQSFPRNSCSKEFAKFWINFDGRVHLQKTGEVFNFIKDRLCLLVPVGIGKIFRKDIFCTPAASYFHCHVILHNTLIIILF